MHTPETQSPAETHAFPFAQGAHDVPPQSVSVSAPFFTPSEQPGAEHSSPAHTADAQSVPVMHESPWLHGGQLPPQSKSVSSPFLTPSEQLGARHRLLLPHTPLWQSAPVEQPPPVVQPGHEPPQSTPVSAPSCA